MVNTKGGKSYKKGKKHTDDITNNKKQTPFADSPELFYAQVKRKLGCNRIEVQCNDGKLKQSIIPGSFYKKVWFNPNDIVLVQISSINVSESYILYKYDSSEVQFLKSQNKLKFNIGTETTNKKTKEDDIIFDDSDDANNIFDREYVFKEVEKNINTKNIDNNNESIDDDTINIDAI